MPDSNSGWISGLLQGLIHSISPTPMPKDIQIDSPYIMLTIWRSYSMYFTYISSIQFLNSTVKQALLMSHLHKWGHWSTKRLSNLPRHIVTNYWTQGSGQAVSYWSQKHTYEIMLFYWSISKSPRYFPIWEWRVPLRVIIGFAFILAIDMDLTQLIGGRQQMKRRESGAILNNKVLGFVSSRRFQCITISLQLNRFQASVKFNNI